MEVRADARDFNAVFDEITENLIRDEVMRIILLLKNSSIVGEHVKHEIIPKYYIKRHGVQTLYRVSLPNNWRLVYSIQSFYEKEPTALLLELMDHKKYNKRFGYFKKKSS